MIGIKQEGKKSHTMIFHIYTKKQQRVAEFCRAYALTLKIKF
jgi:hypothetical protein